ncbi:MAG: hypothetical protein HC880_12190 [Bacteroidia bacterium]|nr:hypothetical protein [Bacteroidia bacterium]
MNCPGGALETNPYQSTAYNTPMGVGLVKPSSARIGVATGRWRVEFQNHLSPKWRGEKERQEINSKC